MSRTPLPWVVVRVGEWKREVQSSHPSAASTTRCLVADIFGDDGVHGREANAEFIVRACNHHDKLVAALKAARTAIIQAYDHMDKDDLPEGWVGNPFMSAPVVAIDETIAEAGVAA